MSSFLPPVLQSLKWYLPLCWGIDFWLQRGTSCIFHGGGFFTAADHSISQQPPTGEAFKSNKSATEVIWAVMNVSSWSEMTEQRPTEAGISQESLKEHKIDLIQPGGKYSSEGEGTKLHAKVHFTDKEQTRPFWVKENCWFSAAGWALSSDSVVSQGQITAQTLQLQHYKLKTKKDKESYHYDSQAFIPPSPSLSVMFPICLITNLPCGSSQKWQTDVGGSNVVAETRKNPWRTPTGCSYLILKKR